MRGSKPTNIFYFFSTDAPGKAGPGSWRPNADIYETDTHVVIALEVPGVRSDNLEITEYRDKLIVKGVRHPEMKDGPKRFHQIEIVCGEFQKEIVLSEQLKGAPVEATLSLGILYLKIQKNVSAEQRGIKQIRIEAE
jgi:HSP20 family protein